MERFTAEQQTGIVASGICEHGRLLDDVRTRDGKPTGEVRCLECGAICEDLDRAGG